jgi:hypothetical protein
MQGGGVGTRRSGRWIDVDERWRPQELIAHDMLPKEDLFDGADVSMRIRPRIEPVLHHLLRKPLR